MATELVKFTPDEDIIHAMRVLLENHYSGAPVVDHDGKLIGIISQKDCMAIVYNTAYHQDIGGHVEQYMHHEVECLDVDTSIFDAADHFLHSNYRRFPVMRDGRLVGQISRHDIMRAIDEIYLQKT